MTRKETAPSLCWASRVWGESLIETKKAVLFHPIKTQSLTGVVWARVHRHECSGSHTAVINGMPSSAFPRSAESAGPGVAGRVSRLLLKTSRRGATGGPVAGPVGLPKSSRQRAYPKICRVLLGTQTQT